jgi:hypothetical protein
MNTSSRLVQRQYQNIIMQRRRSFDSKRRIWIFFLLVSFWLCFCSRTGFVNSLDTITTETDFRKETTTATQVIDENLTTEEEREVITKHPPPAPTTLLSSVGISGSSANTNHPHDRLWGGSGGASTAAATSTIESTKADDEITNTDLFEGEGVSPGENKQQQRRWGSAQQQSYETTATVIHHPHLTTKASDLDDHINPPEGFTITARVYIDIQDKLTHFDALDGDPNNATNQNHNKLTYRSGISLPYYDCGVSGSTTAALPVKQIYFRHSLSAPTSIYMDPSSNDNKKHTYPVLAVALTPLRIELDSGETMDFVAGDVVLFEDSIRPGHKVMVSKELTQLTLLAITLPHPHYHIGKQHLSIKAAITRNQQKTTPCRLPNTHRNDDDSSAINESIEDDMVEMESEKESKSGASNSLPSATTSTSTSNPIFSGNGSRIRYLIFGTIALSLSTLMADFFGRTAPLWLAVGVGGTCFVFGSTYAITMLSDYIYTSISLWHERRMLEGKRSSGRSI